ncbi:MAG: hypothetical protein AAF208_03540 [Cyanobacteria bacterium P01_A01_bin.45]
MKISILSLKKHLIPVLACSSILTSVSIFNTHSTNPAFALQSSSYQRSCKNISVNGNRLSALCRTRRGSYRNTSLTILGIENINGVLQYTR